MSRLAATFAALRAVDRKALVIYVTAGDPDEATSVQAALAAARAGADVLEIGVPFSDPIADGPVIQRAMQRALDGGGGLASALRCVKAIRAQSDAPLVVFGYLNPLLYEGFAAAAQGISDAGADGLLVVDAPPEEAAPYRDVARQVGLDWVSIVAPTTPLPRAAEIARAASGFLYVVSMTGVTGGALVDVERLRPVLEAIREVSQIPLCVGFGVRDRVTAERAAQVADGVVVGSAVVAALEGGGAGPQRVAEHVAELRAGVDAAHIAPRGQAGRGVRGKPVRAS